MVVERSIEDGLEGQICEILRARENSIACVCQMVGRPLLDIMQRLTIIKDIIKTKPSMEKYTMKVGRLKSSSRSSKE